MKKYTLYKASKISKISRYKLEQAIEEGLLQTQEGKGTVKYLISEADLKVFIKEHGDQFVQVKYSDTSEGYSNQNYPFISREQYEKMLFEKERMIQTLEMQLQKNEGLLSKINQITQLSQIITELVNNLPNSKETENLSNRLKAITS